MAISNSSQQKMHNNALMRLPDASIASFKKVYQDYYKVELNDDDANAKAIDLLQFLSMIYKPIPKVEKDAKN